MTQPVLSSNELPLLFAFRHGVATTRLDGYGDEVETATLLPQGLAAVENLASFLAEQKVNALWVSPIKRCQQTAEIVAAATGLAVETQPLLSEYYNESWQDFHSRMNELLNVIRAAGQASHQAGNELRLGVCTHGAVISALSHLATGREFTQWDLFDYPTPAGLRVITPESVSQRVFQAGC